MPSTLLQIFLKAPEPGNVKTRLIPDVGVDKATEIHTRLVEHVLQVAKSTNVDAIQCWTAGNHSHPYIQSLAKTFSVHQQPGKDLGDNMQYALTSGKQDFDKVIIVGGDAYSLTPDYIEQAAEQLDHVDVVLGPAEDGGYILVAAAKSVHGMFDQIAWGTESVLEEQLNQLAALNLSHKLLAQRWDIDDIRDIKQHAPELLN